MKTSTFSLSKEASKSNSENEVVAKNGDVWDLSITHADRLRDDPEVFLIRVFNYSDLKEGPDGKVTAESYDTTLDEAPMEVIENTSEERHNIERWLRQDFGIRVKLIR